MTGWFSVDRIRLAVHGEARRPAMIFQHGLCGTASQPAEVFPEATGYHLCTLESRGHGGSEPGPLEALSIATFADDLIGFITARGLAPLVLGGISMGAALALRIAVRRPDLVRALVLARPAWVAAPAPANMAANALVGDLLSRLPPDQARAAFAASGTAAALAREAPDNLASLRGFFAREPVAVTAALLARIAADGPGVSEAEIAGLALPVLVIGHGRDAVHPIGHARTLAALIRGAVLAEIPAKADDGAAYRAGFRAALAGFLAALRP